MKNRIILFLSLMALFAPITANAQNELTVYEGTAENSRVPAYIYYFDDFTRSQFVIPAEDLADMHGTDISSIKFYTFNYEDEIPYTTESTADVYLMEVNYTTMNGFEPKANGTIVYQGLLDFVTEGNGGSLTINFNSPYTYQGGNLLIGIENTTDDDYEEIYFHGQTVSGASWAGYSGSSLEYVSGSQQNFIPKTTFYYSGSSCSRPTTATVSAITPSSATFNWSESSGVFNVQYKKASDNEWIDRATNYSGNGLTLTGLENNTNYQARVQRVCEDNSVSGWTTASFTTLAGIPFWEEFSSSTPVAWETHYGLLSTIMNGGTWENDESYWSFGQTSGGVFDKHALINVWGEGTQDWIITPNILMEPGVKLSFDIALTKYGETLQAPETTGVDDRFVVLITTDNCATWSILREWNNTGSPYVYNDIAHTANGQAEVIDLSSYSSGFVRIAFYAESTVANADNNLHLDNVSLNSCDRPTNFVCTETSLNSATFDWEGDALSWQIVIDDDYNHPYNISSNPPYTLSGLSAGTHYNAKLRAHCDDQHFSQWTSSIRFMTSYCMPEDQCQITYTLQDSGNDGWNEASILVMDDETGTTIATLTLPEGESLLNGTLTVCNGRDLYFMWNYGDNDEECSYVLRDINGEVIFEGTGEMDEDVEYTVDCTITDCRKPTNLEISEIGNHSVTLSWTENSDATAWVVAYRLLDEEEFQEVNANTNPYTLQNLQSETEYLVKVRPVCDAIKWSSENWFVTEVACPVPTALNVSDITPFTATLGWTSNIGSYDVRYGEYPESTDQEWLTYNVTPTSSYGNSTSFTRTWGVMYPAEMVTGNCLTKIRLYENQYFTNNITIRVYVNGDEAPENLLISTTVPPKGSTGWEEITLPKPLPNIEGRNVWITITTTGTYVLAAGYCEYFNNMWMLVDGEWILSGMSEKGWAIEGLMETLDLDAVEWTTKSSTENSCLMDGLVPETAYLAQVRANCGGEDGESFWGGIYFETIATCPVPEDLTVSGVTGRNATFSWAAEEGATFQYCIKENPVDGYVPTDEEFVGVTNNNTISFVHEFNPDTDYAFYLRKDCGDNDYSHIVSAPFHTTIPCPAPTNLEITDITPTTAQANWTCSTGNYDIRYGLYPEDVNPTWLTYNMIASNNYGSPSTSTRTWGVKYPAEQITGNCLTKIKYCAVPSYFSSAITAKIYSGGENAPETLLYTQTMTPTINGWNEVTLDSPVSIVQGENLWITFTANGTYCLKAGDCDDDNNRWIFTNGTWITWTVDGKGWTIDGLMETVDFNEIDWTTATSTEDSYPLSALTVATPYIFQVRSNCGAEDGESEWVTAFFTTDDGIIFITDGNWNEGSNWYLGTVPEDNADVIIAADAIIPDGYDAKVNNITIDGGSITIKDGGQLHSNVAVQATLEKTITGFTSTNNHYYLIANPLNTDINPTAFGLTIGDYDLYRFDGTQFHEEWRNHKSTPFNMTAGIGYLYANANDVTLQFTGTVRKQYSTLFYNGTALTYDTDNPFGTWNLVGNMFPYNGYVYIGTISGSSATITSTYYYKMNETGTELVLSNESVKPCEGIFVQTTTVNQYAFVTSTKRDGYTLGLRMNLTQGNKLLDVAVLEFGKSNSIEKFQLNPNHTKVFIPQEGKDYAVANAEGQVGEVPVSFKAEKNGAYTLSFNTEEVSFNYLQLIDNITGTEVDLLATPDYTFEAFTTDYDSRFKLVFATGSSEDGDNFGFINSMGNLCIFGIEGTAIVEVIDITGRVLSSEHFSGNYEKHINATPGLYMLRLIQGNDVKTQKIVIE